jgi:hypothetical protein
MAGGKFHRFRGHEKLQLLHLATAGGFGYRRQSGRSRNRIGQAIISYLRYCRDTQEGASFAGAKRYLETGNQCGPFAKDALHWFFVASRRRQGLASA